MNELKARTAFQIGAHAQRHDRMVVQDGDPDDRRRARQQQVPVRALTVGGGAAGLGGRLAGWL
ncbi:hypothetical protein D3C71_1745990 [compost metagenome]